VGELTDGDPRYLAALEALIRGRLLVAREGEEGGVCEVAHEALMQGWGALAGWIEEARETRELRVRLESAARDWERADRRADLLWAERALLLAARLEPEQLSQREQRFLHASRRRLRRLRTRRIALGVGVVLIVAGVVLGMRFKASFERTRAASADLQQARAIWRQAQADETRERHLREQSFAAFDARQEADGERRWTEALAQSEQVGARYAAANDLLERALTVDPERPDVRAALAQVLLAQALRAERAGQKEVEALLAQRLRRVDRQGAFWAQWSAPATLVVRAPPEGHLELSRYPSEGGAAWTPTRVALDGPLVPGVPRSLPRGSYLLVWRGDTTSQRLAVVLERGERREVDLRPPPRVPSGMVYVPPGRFRFGSGDEESVRQFLNAAPVHDVVTGGYLIARDETTWAQYLAWLDTLHPRERAAHLPKGGSTGLYGGLRLRKLPSGRWELSIQPTSTLLTAVEGQPLRYPGRKERAEVDWRRLPVVGITSADAAAYAAWLDQSGRLPGARLCDEREWERAGRGADERAFPNGNRLSPSDANFDATYGKDPLSFGPDEVGSHPASDSPYGVRDLAGNVWEWTRSALAPDQAVARGGSYYFAASSCRLTNREIPEPSFRDLTVGMRICADLRID
jgi:formylglycine-generating enzyme required for sulfatase activity